MYSSYCKREDIKVIGIGLGIYLKGIQNLFDKVVYAKNPMIYLKELVHCLIVL